MKENCRRNAARAGRVAAVYFVFLGALMYYFMSQIIVIPYTIPVRFLIMIAFILSVLIVFLIRPDFAGAVVAVKGAMVLSVPFLVMVTVSLPIWFVERVEWVQIYRSLWHHLLYVNQPLAALVASAFLYLFGEKGIWYNLLSILAANLAMIGTIIWEQGIGAYWSDLVQLIVSFAGVTGNVIQDAEFHELAFCLGAYLVYMFLFAQKKPVFLLYMGATVFCFLSAFKRIAIVAFLISLAAGWGLQYLNRKGLKRLVNLLMTGIMLFICVFLVFYVDFVRIGGFHWLEKLGINTMSRADMYDQIKNIYSFSPFYAGHGMGYLSYHLTRLIHIWETAIHNDFLQFYVDLGFFGYIFWILSFTLFRILYFGGEKNTENGILAFSIICYMLILSATDNSLNYVMFYVTTGLLIMGRGFEQREEEEEARLFANKG